MDSRQRTEPSLVSIGGGSWSATDPNDLTSKGHPAPFGGPRHMSGDCGVSQQHRISGSCGDIMVETPRSRACEMQAQAAANENCLPLRVGRTSRTVTASWLHRLRPYASGGRACLRLWWMVSTATRVVAELERGEEDRAMRLGTTMSVRHLLALVSAPHCLRPMAAGAAGTSSDDSSYCTPLGGPHRAPVGCSFSHPSPRQEHQISPISLGQRDVLPQTHNR